MLCLATSTVACEADPKATVPSPPAAASEPPADPALALVPAGDLRADQAVIKFAVYGMPSGPGGVLTAAQAIHAQDFAGLHAVDADGRGTTPSVLIVAPPMAEFAPPSPEELRSAGRGLSGDQMRAVQRSTEAVVMAFAGTKEQLPALHRDALRMTAAVAARTGGVVWDEDTGQLFGVDAWTKRVAADPTQPRNVGQHIAIHSTRTDELVRQVTFGMGKYGLPDILVRDVPPASAEAMGRLVNLVAASFVTTPSLATAGQLALDVPAPAPARPKASPSSIQLTLVRPERTPDLPENRVLEIVFVGPAPSLHERQAAVLARLTGARDRVTKSRLDPQVVEASMLAKQRLALLQPAFTQGFDERETLLVKAPFKTKDQGKEWMWVEVLTWEGDEISGILQNDPAYVDELESGARVEVAQASVFDYIHKKADGTIVGNETAALIEAKAKQAERGWNAGMKNDEPAQPRKLSQQQ